MAKKNKIVVFSLITLIIVSCCWLDFVFIKENSQFLQKNFKKQEKQAMWLLFLTLEVMAQWFRKKLMTLSQLLII